MNQKSTQTQDETAIAADLTAEVYKDLIKATLALPLEGCKSMAIGCATVAGLYGAVVAFVNYGHPPHPWQLEIYVIMAPFVLLSVSGLIFGAAYLPNVRLEQLLSSLGRVGDNKWQMDLVVGRERFLRDRIFKGSMVFWFALVWALVCVAFVRVPC